MGTRGACAPRKERVFSAGVVIASTTLALAGKHLPRKGPKLICHGSDHFVLIRRFELGEKMFAFNYELSSNCSLDVMPHMNGRFPYDVFLIILGPFVMIAASQWLTPLLMRDHVHHDLAVAITATLGAGLAFTLLVFSIRRRRHRKT